MAEVQVPPRELRGRRRSADTDVDVEPLFDVQFRSIFRGGVANPQSALGFGTPEESTLQPALIDYNTIPHHHLLHSKSPPLTPLLNTYKSFKQKVVNFFNSRSFPLFISFAPLTWVFSAHTENLFLFIL
jgi:hypothetical protein